MNFAKESWMLYPGIILLSSFLPFTVYSFRHYRLPKKREEYKILMKRLEKEGIEDPGTISILENEYSSGDYILPLSFVTVFSILGFFVLFSKEANLLLSGMELINTAEKPYQTGSIVAIGMAFLGTYVWSVQYIFRRLVTIDLPPGAYYNVGIRMVFGSFVALIFYQFITALPSGEFAISGSEIDVVPDIALKNMVPVIAFLTGIFPQRALHYIMERFTFTTSKAKKKAEELPLDMLQGMTGFNKVRLSELGIENVQNIVEASLVELILKSPYKPRLIIDWMAQGKLCLHFKSEVQAMRDVGVRTILDFKKVGDEGKLNVLAERTKLNADQLDIVYQIIKDNTGIDRLSKAERCLHVI